MGVYCKYLRHNTGIKVKYGKCSAVQGSAVQYKLVQYNDHSKGVGLG